MDEHTPASGEEQPLHEGPFRRAYAWPILWEPWVTSVIGLALLVFGMAVNSPAPVRVTALGLGPITIVAGLLLPRMQGSLELSATGFKGQLDSIPAALVLAAHTGAEKAIPEGEPDRDQRAWEAADQAVASLSPFLNRVFISHSERDHVPGLKQLMDSIRRGTDPSRRPPACCQDVVMAPLHRARNR